MKPRARHSIDQCLSLMALCAIALLLLSVGQAQPSGGPYGPQPQKYELPSGAAHIYYVAPDGLADAPGMSLEQPTTLESAISRVVTGDAIIMRGGTYRTGGLKLNQGITIQPYQDEQPIIKGTQVATRWQAQVDGLWRTSWSRLFPSKPAGWWNRAREGNVTPVYRFNNDMVFVDGRPLKQVGWEGEIDQDSFSVDYDAGNVYIGINPSDRLVEITAFDSAIVRTMGEAHGKTSDHKGYVIRGVTFTQYAYRALEIEAKEPEGPADPATFGKDVVGTTLENVTITHCSRVAGYFRGDKFTMRNCLISDTSTEGVYLISSADCLLEKNIFRRNNVEKITGYYPSAVKIFNQCHRVTCRDNLVMDNPDSNGIWYDVGNVDGVFIDNWVENALVGFFFEISKNALCAGNVFVNCGKGIWALNSSNVRAYQNTLVDAEAAFTRTERSAVGDRFGWHPATGPDVDKREGHAFVGNLLVADEDFQRPLARFEQSKLLCGRLTKSMMTEVDDNVYVRRGAPGQQVLLIWGPVEGENCNTELKSLDELRALRPELEKDSLDLQNFVGPVFKSADLKNYELVKWLSGFARTPALPAEVESLLGWPKQEKRIPGAFPALD
jgi:parallel beta-helix repeat protein